MNAVLPKSPPPTLPDIPSATSSLASEAGPTPSDLPAGPMLDLFGQVRVPVSRSAQPAKVKAAPTIDISGRIGRGSSASVNLTRSLVSRLKARLPTDGSTLFQMTWNEKATPSGRFVSLLRASAHRIGDNGSGLSLKGWTTPTVGDDNMSRRSEASMERYAMRDKPNASVAREAALILGAWPSPCAQQANGEPGAFLQRKRKSVAKTGRSMGIVLSDLNMVAKTVLASWPTPTANEMPTGANAQANLRIQAHLSSWPTPSATKNTKNSKDPQAMKEKGVQTALADAAWMARGTISSGSPAETGKAGQLNPAFSRWLQGYPVAWCQAAIRVKRTLTPRRKREPGACAATATPSSRKSRPK